MNARATLFTIIGMVPPPPQPPATSQPAGAPSRSTSHAELLVALAGRFRDAARAVQDPEALEFALTRIADLLDPPPPPRPTSSTLGDPADLRGLLCVICGGKPHGLAGRDRHAMCGKCAISREPVNDELVAQNARVVAVGRARARGNAEVGRA